VGGEPRARLDSLSEAELDGLLAELVADSSEEAVRAALDACGLGAVAEAESPSARLDQLSDAEVDGLLGELLSQEGHVA
jgi:hypothetical protein